MHHFLLFHSIILMIRGNTVEKIYWKCQSTRLSTNVVHLHFISGTWCNIPFICYFRSMIINWCPMGGCIWQFRRRHISWIHYQLKHFRAEMIMTHFRFSSVRKYGIKKIEMTVKSQPVQFRALRRSLKLQLMFKKYNNNHILQTISLILSFFSFFFFKGNAQTIDQTVYGSISFIFRLFQMLNFAVANHYLTT